MKRKGSVKWFTRVVDKKEEVVTIVGIPDIIAKGKSVAGFHFPGNALYIGKKEKKWLKRFEDIFFHVTKAALPLRLYWSGGDINHVAIRPSPGGKICIYNDKFTDIKRGDRRLSIYRDPLPQ